MRNATRPVSLYSVHANPANDFYICTAGKDSYVHVFDRRTMSDLNQTPVKKFCPSHLVRFLCLKSAKFVNVQFTKIDHVKKQ